MNLISSVEPKTSEPAFWHLFISEFRGIPAALKKSAFSTQEAIKEFFAATPREKVKQLGNLTGYAVVVGSAIYAANKVNIKINNYVEKNLSTYGRIAFHLCIGVGISLLNDKVKQMNSPRSNKTKIERLN